MGLAASQARYLSLTSRKSDLEYQSQTINTRRLQLAYKTASVAQAFSEGMNNKTIHISIGKDQWEKVNWKNIRQGGYMVIGTGGRPMDDMAPPYVIDKVQEITGYKGPTSATDSTEKTITPEDYEKLKKDDPALAAQYTEVFTEIKADAYNALPASEEKFNNYKVTYKENPYLYTSKSNVELEDRLRNGQCSFVTQDFYQFLVAKYAFDPQKGMDPEIFAAAQQDYENLRVDNERLDADTVVDWSTDETSNFRDMVDESDEEKTLREYEAATAAIQAQDKRLELEVKNIETQHKAIETELENVKKVIQKNIEETFKIFS